MSTTEQMPTTEQMVQNKLKGLRNYFATLQEQFNSVLPPNRSFVVPYLDTSTDAIAILSRLNPKSYNSVKTTICRKLSKKNRFKLEKGFDSYHTFQCLVLPDEKVLKATLYASVVCPADPVLKKQWMEGTLENSEWQYQSSSVEKHYVPLKTVHNIQGPFTFYDTPINNLYPFTELSVEITYDPSNQYQMPLRRILVETYMWNCEEREACVQKLKINK